MPGNPHSPFEKDWQPTGVLNTGIDTIGFRRDIPMEDDNLDSLIEMMVDELNARGRTGAVSPRVLERDMDLVDSIGQALSLHRFGQEENDVSFLGDDRPPVRFNAGELPVVRPFIRPLTPHGSIVYLATAPDNRVHEHFTSVIEPNVNDDRIWCEYVSAFIGNIRVPMNMNTVRFRTESAPDDEVSHHTLISELAVARLHGQITDSEFNRSQLMLLARDTLGREVGTIGLEEDEVTGQIHRVYRFPAREESDD